MSPDYFRSQDEVVDLADILIEARKQGATSGGIFGSRLKGGWTDKSDIDVVVNNPNAPVFGEVDWEFGQRSNSRFHIFLKKPGLTGGVTSREQLLNRAEKEHKPLFGTRRRSANS